MGNTYLLHRTAARLHELRVRVLDADDLGVEPSHERGFDYPAGLRVAIGNAAAVAVPFQG